MHTIVKRINTYHSDMRKHIHTHACAHTPTQRTKAHTQGQKSLVVDVILELAVIVKFWAHILLLLRIRGNEYSYVWLEGMPRGKMYL